MSRDDPLSVEITLKPDCRFSIPRERDNAPGRTAAPNRKRLGHAVLIARVYTGFWTAPEPHPNGLHRGKSLVARDALPNISDAQEGAGQVTRACSDGAPLPSARSLWRMAAALEWAWTLNRAPL